MLVSLREILNIAKEGNFSVDWVLSSFSCPKDKSIEDFLLQKSIKYEETGKSRTYFIVDDEKLDEGIFEMYAYFSVALKSLNIPCGLSNNQIKKLDGIGSKINGESITTIPCYLIGQLSKNFGVKDNPVSGNDIIAEAMSIIMSSQLYVGGRSVLVESKKTDKLIDFYLSNGFVQFSEVTISGEDYVQFLLPLI